MTKEFITTKEKTVDISQVQIGLKSGDPADAEKGKAQRAPRRIIYFQNGDELEDYSTDEEENEPDRVDLAVSNFEKLDWKSMGWGSYLMNLGLFGLLKTIKSFENAGEVISYKLGITSPKYQSEIEEAERMEVEDAEEKQRAKENDASWNLEAPIDTHLKTPQENVNPPAGMVLSSPLASSTPFRRKNLDFLVFPLSTSTESSKRNNIQPH